MEGSSLEFLPTCVSQSNNRAKKPVQEMWNSAYVMLIATETTDYVYIEALHHSNYMRNRLPSKSAHHNLPIRLWNLVPILSTATIPTSVQPRFIFVHLPSIASNSKLLPRTIRVVFVCMERHKRLCWTFNSAKLQVYIVLGQILTAVGLIRSLPSRCLSMVCLT